MNEIKMQSCKYFKRISREMMGCAAGEMKAISNKKAAPKSDPFFHYTVSDALGDIFFWFPSEQNLSFSLGNVVFTTIAFHW
jgi:hypothetical protein